MSGTAARRQRETPENPSDKKLIARCIKGDEAAWTALIDKYKNLIYSIPIKLGMYQEAGDIFQAVCVELLTGLPQLREDRALPKWLIQTCYHKCLRQQRVDERHVELEAEDLETTAELDGIAVPEAMLVQLENEQMVRDAISDLPDRCTRLIQMLFFEVPSRPYEDVAKELGLATGSIGFIRGRCLSRLKKELEKKGF